jgi:hypothetical protein
MFLRNVVGRLLDNKMLWTVEAHFTAAMEGVKGL